LVEVWIGLAGLVFFREVAGIRGKAQDIKACFEDGSGRNVNATEKTIGRTSRKGRNHDTTRPD
jgi:hypothetical protein